MIAYTRDGLIRERAKAIGLVLGHLDDAPDDCDCARVISDLLAQQSADFRDLRAPSRLTEGQMTLGRHLRGSNIKFPDPRKTA